MNKENDNKEEEIKYNVIDTWKNNKIVFTGNEEQSTNYLRGNNTYQMNYSKLKLNKI